MDEGIVILLGNYINEANRGAGMSFLPRETALLIELGGTTSPSPKCNRPPSSPLRDGNLLGIEREFVWANDVPMTESYSYFMNSYK